jgi:hypothetical protein
MKLKNQKRRNEKRTWAITAANDIPRGNPIEATSVVLRRTETLTTRRLRGNHLSFGDVWFDVVLILRCDCWKDEWREWQCVLLLEGNRWNCSGKKTKGKERPLMNDYRKLLLFFFQTLESKNVLMSS